MHKNTNIKNIHGVSFDFMLILKLFLVKYYIKVELCHDCYMILSSCSSQLEMNSHWLQDFAPYSPSSEVDSSSATLESPVNSYSWIKQEPETVVIKWDNINTLPAATETEQDNTPSSATATSST